jgi:RNA polymerase sigma-70 factor (ECF subfamily)
MAQGKGSGDESRASRFEAMFRASYPRVLAYALRRTKDRGSAEEVASETFLIAWRRLDAVPEEEPLPWLLGTARRVLANQRRSLRRRSPNGPNASIDSGGIPQPGPLPFEQIAEREAFAAAFAALGDRDREALSLIAWDGLGVGEAAKVTGCTAPVFSVRLHRARRRLLKELEASGHSLGEAGKRSPLGERPGISEAP